jgi:hypothetical protein
VALLRRLVGEHAATDRLWPVALQVVRHHLNPSIRAACEVSASTRTRGASKRATRRPTSPQPTMSTRLRRKRAGKAPKGLWFEGKIGAYVRCKPQG